MSEYAVTQLDICKKTPEACTCPHHDVLGVQKYLLIISSKAMRIYQPMPNESNQDLNKT